jgi:hypothetical protein
VIHIGIVQTVLVHGLDGCYTTTTTRSGGARRKLKATLGSLILYDFEYSAYITLDSKKREYLTRLVLVRSCHGCEDQHVVHEVTRRLEQQFMD